MVSDFEFERVFNRMRGDTTSAARRRYLTDLQGMLEETSDVLDLLKDARYSPNRRVLVSFDRTYRTKFSYLYFDLTLLLLTRVHGGSAVHRPTAQNRVIVWRNRKRDLLSILRFVRRHFGTSHHIRFSRALIVPYPSTTASYNPNVIPAIV